MSASEVIYMYFIARSAHKHTITVFRVHSLQAYQEIYIMPMGNYKNNIFQHSSHKCPWATIA